MADRCAVVTGVSKGLGEALAANLLARGFEVVGIGRAAAGRLASPDFRLVRADLAQLGELASTVDSLFTELASRRFASIAVVNNAATAEPAGTFGDVDAPAIAEAIGVNLVAPAIVASAFVKAFRLAAGDRRLINVSSGAAARAIPGIGVYSVAKAGIEMLSAAIASEQPASGIRSIAIRPGIIDTPMQVFARSQPASRLPSVGMFQAFHEGRQLVPPDVTAAKLVDRLILGTIESGRVYDYAQL